MPTFLPKNRGGYTGQSNGSFQPVSYGATRSYSAGNAGLTGGTFMSPAPADFVSPQQQLATQLQTAYDAANKANTERYDDILAKYKAFTQQTMGQLGNLGTQERKDINQNYLGTVSQGQQDLVGSGLYGSTVMPSVRIGAERQRSADIRKLNDAISQTKLGYRTNLFNNKINFMANRNDIQPDLTGILGMAQ